MNNVLKMLSALCWLCAISGTFFFYYFPFNPDFVQNLWDYVIDPVIIATLILVVIANVHISLNLRNRGETAHALQFDLFTSVAGFTAALYLHNYVLKFADAFDPLQTMWDFLLAAVIVIMAIAAITYWRKATR